MKSISYLKLIKIQIQNVYKSQRKIFQYNNSINHIAKKKTYY